MLRTEPQFITYHGWDIKVVMNQDEFSFECYPPTLPDFCNDGMAYASLNDAIAAACYFVDREIAILALMDVVTDWLEDGTVSEDEYWQLTSFD